MRNRVNWNLVDLIIFFKIMEVKSDYYLEEMFYFVKG